MSEERLDAGALALPGLEVRVLAKCTSTNSVLLDLAAAWPLPCLLAAEEQTAGRGRRGRRWHSAPGASATFSLACRIGRPARELPGLSLVAGVAAARALRGLGVPVQLKWPNDLVVGEAKLGGILVETRSSTSGTLAVFGIGVNCRHDARVQRRLQHELTSLDCHLGHLGTVDRNRVIAAIAGALLQELERFERQGLAPVLPEWERLDAHAGRRVRVRLADGRRLSGVASGLSDDGSLRLRTAQGMRTVRSATVVAARAAPAASTPIMEH
jgi:BirA family biotin operon repressor/biotin-[acetyl-CoA-carboxylase] ligase